MKKNRVFVSLAAFAIAFSILLSSCTKEKNQAVSGDASFNAAEIAAEKAGEYAENGNPVGIIVTNLGECIVMELYRDIAPQTVGNFISLANKGFYDGLIFHRVIPGFMIQGGDPNGNGQGGPGYEIFGEFTNNGFRNDLSHQRGVVSMARKGSQTDPASMYNTAGSQFFICVADASSSLDGDYAAFGKVLEGMDAVDRIVSAPRDSANKPYEDQVMAYVRVAENGVLPK